MKNVFINLIAICLVFVGYSQTSKDEAKEVELTGVTVSPLNMSYLNSVEEDEMPEFVKNLENKAARFNITESPIYDGNFEAYEVMFSQSNGTVLATYDQKGKILETTERFKNITLPYNVRTKIYKEHPGWVIHSDAYLVSYFHNQEVEKICKVQLRKDGKRKNLKIDMDGNSL
jgi:hypothetical protein